MKVKMLTSAVTKDFKSLMQGCIYELEEKMALELIKCNFAILIEQPKQQLKKTSTKKRKPSESKGE